MKAHAMPGAIIGLGMLGTGGTFLIHYVITASPNAPGRYGRER